MSLPTFMSPGVRLRVSDNPRGPGDSPYAGMRCTFRGFTRAGYARVTADDGTRATRFSASYLLHPESLELAHDA